MSLPAQPLANLTTALRPMRKGMMMNDNELDRWSGMAWDNNIVKILDTLPGFWFWLGNVTCFLLLRDRWSLYSYWVDPSSGLGRLRKIVGSRVWSENRLYLATGRSLNLIPKAPFSNIEIDLLFFFFYMYKYVHQHDLLAPNSFLGWVQKVPPPLYDWCNPIWVQQLFTRRGFVRLRIPQSHDKQWMASCWKSQQEIHKVAK